MIKQPYRRNHRSKRRRRRSQSSRVVHISIRSKSSRSYSHSVGLSDVLLFDYISKIEYSRYYH